MRSDVMSFSIRLNKEEETLAKSYATLHGFSLGEAFKKTLFKKIEEEYDIAVAEIAHNEFVKEPKTYIHDEVLKMLQDEVI